MIWVGFGIVLLAYFGAFTAAYGPYGIVLGLALLAVLAALLAAGFLGCAVIDAALWHLWRRRSRRHGQAECAPPLLAVAWRHARAAATRAEWTAQDAEVLGAAGILLRQERER